MKLRFVMSRRRKNSVRDKVIGKKCIYLERYTVYRQNAVHLKRRAWPWEKHPPQSVGHLRRQEALKYGMVSFYGLGDFIRKGVGGLFQLSWRRGGDFQELGPRPLVDHVLVSPRTVMAPVDMSLS